jgi:hypothetical protein
MFLACLMSITNELLIGARHVTLDVGTNHYHTNTSSKPGVGEWG